MSGKVIYEVERDWRGNGPYTVEYQGFNEDIWREWGAYGTEVEARAMANTLLSVERIYKARVVDTLPRNDEFEYRHVCRRTSGCGEE